MPDIYNLMAIGFPLTATVAFIAVLLLVRWKPIIFMSLLILVMLYACTMPLADHLRRESITHIEDQS